MGTFINLIQNETIKLQKRRRFLLVILILIVLIGLIAYGQHITQTRLIQQLGTTDWHVRVKQLIQDYTNRQKSIYVPDNVKQSYQIFIQQAQYNLSHNINPYAPGTATFVRKFMDQSSSLLLPLLVITLAADLVSSEWGMGTIKLLLTRPVVRWKILLSKYISMLFFISLMFVITACICTLIGGMFWGFEGWDMPVATGFQVHNGQLDSSHAFNVPQWVFIIENYGLSWYVSIIVATVTFLVSILMRSTAATMGIMLAALIGGNILSELATSWTSLKYMFVMNLGITNYLNGSLPPIEGMTLPFSMVVLTTWGIAAFLLSFIVFIRRDVLA